MNLLDTLDIYALIHDSDDMFLLLNDYTLDNRINRENLNRVILKELGAMRPITTDSELFKRLLEIFFDKYNYNITRLLDTMYLQYDPLNNKDIVHHVHETENRHSVGDIDNTDEYTTNTDNTETGTSTTESSVSAYDSSGYQPKDKSVTTPNTRVDNDVEHVGTTTSDIVSTVDTDKDMFDTTTGKDGEASYQDLIEQERKSSEFNIFNWIIQQMRKELFLLVY